MFRLVLWLGFFYLLFRLIKGKPPPPPAATSGGETMVKCQVCGVYIPRDEALGGGLRRPGQYFCSPECRRRA